MKRIEFSDNAEKQLQEIYEYLFGAFGEKVANDRVQKLTRDIYMLEDHPFMGRAIEDRDQNLRTLYSAPNIVLYDVNDTVVEILLITDARANYKNMI